VFSGGVDSLVRRSDQVGGGAVPASNVRDELSAVVRAYIAASERLPARVTFMPTVAELLGKSTAAVTPLPDGVGNHGRWVTLQYKKALNRLSQVPGADVLGMIFAWNRWVSALDTRMDRAEIAKLANKWVTDALLQTKVSAATSDTHVDPTPEGATDPTAAAVPLPSGQISALPDSNQVAVENAAAYLARNGRIELAVSYLAEADPYRRRAVLKAAVGEADADLLRALGQLSRGTAVLGSERAQVNMINALANAIDGHIPLSRIVGANEIDTSRKRAAALGLSREFVPRYFTDSDKVQWVDLIGANVDKYPERALGLEVLGSGVVDC
jgi:hypothetical protein